MTCFLESFGQLIVKHSVAPLSESFLVLCGITAELLQEGFDLDESSFSSQLKSASFSHPLLSPVVLNAKVTFSSSKLFIESTFSSSDQSHQPDNVPLRFFISPGFQEQGINSIQQLIQTSQPLSHETLLSIFGDNKNTQLFSLRQFRHTIFQNLTYPSVDCLHDFLKSHPQAITCQICSYDVLHPPQQQPIQQSTQRPHHPPVSSFPDDLLSENSMNPTTVPTFYGGQNDLRIRGICDDDLYGQGGRVDLQIRPPQRGGNLVGPNHPIFGRGPGLRDPFDDTIPPPGSIPPGARYDPVRPFQSQKRGPRLPPQHPDLEPYGGNNYDYI
ncbi:hypothetical protein BLNAU_376 [Blattamonas nauphoetae]|uniref:PI31 proteasome regulator C-terminal domain-containing protein n=1 Tax=Blattamonas nauphoetae TaxID=2049346 RepID=A0ABQ9YLC8_9EUKA|nr:hypothetical protein BLNAU_376 [Blattamonas nauphoetae]